jgi:hypothetical protein
MTCDCVDELCSGVICEEGQICRNSTGGSAPSCSIKTLCEIQSEGQLSPLGSTAVLECLPDGSFRPLQCNPRTAECWCVDGLGQEVTGSRTTVFIDEHKPACVRNNTVSMHIHMTLVVRHDISNNLDSLNSTLIDHVSSWLLIEPHYIHVTKASPLSDETGDRPRLLVVEMVVYHDGHTDLPSAGNYMRQRMHRGGCGIMMGSDVIHPNPQSMRMEHHFEHEPPKTVECFDSHGVVSMWRRGRLMRMSCYILFVCLVLSLVSASILAIKRRRRMHQIHQFDHKRLSNDTLISQNSVVEDGEKSPVVLEKDEKYPIA